MILIGMDIQDKYGIQEAIDLHVTNQSVVEVSDRSFGLKSIVQSGNLLGKICNNAGKITI